MGRIPRRRTARGNSVLLCAVAIIALMFGPAGAHAQSTSSTLSGTVADQSGGVLPGASITLTSASTGLQRTVVSGSNGEFQFPNLDAGSFVMLVHLSGFADVSRGVELLAR